MEANAHTGSGKVSAEELTAGDEADLFEEQRQSTQKVKGDNASVEKRLSDEEVVQNAWIVMLAG